MRRLLSVAALSLAVTLSAGIAVAGTSTREGEPVVRVATDDGRGLRVAACVIRWEAHPTSSRGRSRPYLYVNRTHPCPGVSRVWADYRSGALMLDPTSSWAPIIHFSPQPDETLTRLGIDAGASVGSVASVQLARNGRPIRADDPLFVRVRARANLWVLALSLDLPRAPDPTPEPDPTDPTDSPPSEG